MLFSLFVAKLEEVFNLFPFFLGFRLKSLLRKSCFKNKYDKKPFAPEEINKKLELGSAKLCNTPMFMFKVHRLQVERNWCILKLSDKYDKFLASENAWAFCLVP